jgi:uncharacterized protein YjbI with pentapeptide repeats
MPDITLLKDLIDTANKSDRIVTDPIKIDGLNIVGKLDFRYFVFKQDVSITKTLFQRGVDFSFAVFEREANFEGSEFQGETKFRAVQARCDFNITDAIFEDETSFMDIHVSELFRAGGAQFGGEKACSTRFDRAQIAKDALFCYPDEDKKFKPVRFKGDAHFPGAVISGTARFHAAEFHGKVDFELARIGGDAYFTPAVHEGWPRHVIFYENARFWGTYFQSNAEFDGAHFLKEADFELARIDNNAHFRHYVQDDKKTKQQLIQPIIFGGKASFLNVHVKGTANFSGAQFGAKAIFAHAQFDSPAYFSINKGTEPSSFDGEAHFHSARFERQADFRKVSFVKEAIFDRTEIKGAALFQGAKFAEKAIFEDAHFNVVSFRERDKNLETPLWEPQFCKTVNMIGFNYERIDADVQELLNAFTYEPPNVGSSEPPGKDYLQALKERELTPFHRQPYTQLQKSLRALGDDRTADDVYLEQRRRQRRQLKERVGRTPERLKARRESRGRLSHLSDLLQQILFNYGIRPFRLLWISLAVILLGSFIFNLEGAVVLKEKEKGISPQGSVSANAAAPLNPAPANPAPDKPAPERTENLDFTQALGVSFNQFIPIVEIPSGSSWKPSTRLLPGISAGIFSFSFYGTLHRLAGAILVPLGVAALAGILQRKEKPGK